MRYYSKFIVFLIHLLFVQSKNYHPNYFYENLFKSTNRSKSSTSLSTNVRQLAPSPQVFNEQSYFETQIERSTEVIPTFSRLKTYNYDEPIARLENLCYRTGKCL
jgi:hypothetical protein